MDASAGTVHGMKMDRWKILNAWEFAEIKKCDVLYVTDNLMKRVKDWVQDADISEESKIIFDGIPMQKLILDFSKNKELNGSPEFVSVIVDHKTRNIFIEWDSAGYREFYIRREWTYNPYSDTLTHVKSIPEQNNLENEKAVLIIVFTVFLFVIQTMMKTPEEVLVEKAAKRHTKNKGSRKGRRVVRYFKCYSITGKRAPEAKEKHKILCPAWSVRGHMRHYKSGKVVFINPYIKGKKRNENEFAPKEHKIFPTIKMEVESGKAEGL